MDFDLSEDEELFKAAAERFVADRYDIDQRRQWRNEAHGFSMANWSLMGELGLIGAMFAEEDGGLGLGTTAQATIFEALGRGLVVEPLAESALLAGGLFARIAPQSLKAEWMALLVSGERRRALAHREERARNNPAWVETVVRRNGEGCYLTGSKSVVPAGLGADAFIVSARVSGEPGAHDGISLFLVPANAIGLHTRHWRLMDGTVVASLELDSVHVEAGACLGGGLPEIEAALSRASLAASAESLGIMEKLFHETLYYLKTRQQFGVPLGSFQALQHRMASQYAVIEQARGLLTLAAMENSVKAIDGARAFIAEASVTLGHEMIQMHGGMGVTDELSIGHGHKRLLVLSRWPDDAAAALDRYAAAG